MYTTRAKVQGFLHAGNPPRHGPLIQADTPEKAVQGRTQYRCTMHYRCDGLVPRIRNPPLSSRHGSLQRGQYTRSSMRSSVRCSVSASHRSYSACVRQRLEVGGVLVTAILS